MSTTPTIIQASIRADVETLWDYHHMHHSLRPTDVGIGLGSHDPGVAIVAADLFKRGLFPRLVFTGANSPTTIDRFPRGEAIHYREYVIEHGVPPDAVLVEPAATNTAENIDYTRRLLATRGVGVESAIIMCRPYQQRRAYATCRKRWPEIEVLCASHPLSLDDYVATIGDADRVVNMLVGDTQRVKVYADLGYAVPQETPADVWTAFHRLVAAGFVSRLVDQP